jgi:hypothetical protein
MSVLTLLMLSLQLSLFILLLTTAVEFAAEPLQYVTDSAAAESATEPLQSVADSVAGGATPTETS